MATARPGVYRPAMAVLLSKRLGRHLTDKEMKTIRNFQMLKPRDLIPWALFLKQLLQSEFHPPLLPDISYYIQYRPTPHL